MSITFMTTHATTRPRLSQRLLDGFRAWVARDEQRRAIAHLDPPLRRDIGLPVMPQLPRSAPWSGL
jgi:hypothetical protein